MPQITLCDIFKLIPDRFRVSLDYDHRRRQTRLSDAAAHATSVVGSEKQMVADSLLIGERLAPLMCDLCYTLRLPERVEKAEGCKNPNCNLCKYRSQFNTAAAPAST